MTKRLNTSIADEAGMETVEWAIVIALVVLGVAAAFSSGLGVNTKGKIEALNNVAGTSTTGTGGSGQGGGQASGSGGGQGAGQSSGGSSGGQGSGQGSGAGDGQGSGQSSGVGDGQGSGQGGGSGNGQGGEQGSSGGQGDVLNGDGGRPEKIEEAPWPY